MSVPRASVALPWVEVVDDPVAELAAARARHGDTFVVDAPEGPWLFVLGPAGVRAFYALEERVASKGIADWLMLRRKLPPELFDGRRTLPHQLWTRAGSTSYLEALDRAVDASFDELGAEGAIDAFAWARRLGHRMGLAAWGGLPPDATPELDALIGPLDRLDGAAAFVDPAATRAIEAGGHVEERVALTEIEARLAPRVDAQRGREPDDLFGAIVQRWDDEDREVARQGAARDVVLVHLGSMSNLFAGLAWNVLDVVAHPELADPVAAGDVDLAERCALESLRLAQRSIMSRSVLRPFEMVTDLGAVALAPGATVATLLPLTNTTAAPGLDRYDPRRWVRGRLADVGTEAAPAVRELVATFGHGAHACPARPFSLAAMVRATGALLRTYEVRLLDERPAHRPGQIGGVARPDGPARLAYARRGGGVASWR